MQLHTKHSVAMELRRHRTSLNVSQEEFVRLYNKAFPEQELTRDTFAKYEAGINAISTERFLMMTSITAEDIKPFAKYKNNS